MEIITEEHQSKYIKLSITKDNKEIARAHLFLIKNSLHQKPYGLFEDLFVEPEFRGKGLGRQLIEKIIEEAKKQGCYKLLATSRYSREKVHELYLKIGFQDYGKEFRMNLE